MKLEYLPYIGKIIFKNSHFYRAAGMERINNLKKYLAAYMEMQEFVAKLKDPLRPYGKGLDVLPYYAFVARCLKGFLGQREIAAKCHLGEGRFFIKRGSQMPPMSAAQLAEWTDMRLVEAREKHEHLDEARKELSKEQQLVWSYFLPRKFSDFFHATNFEKPGREISRVFLDIDRREGATLENAREAACLLLEGIKADKEFEKKTGGFRTFQFYTGKSFHIYLLLDKALPAKFYSDNLTGEGSFTRKWVDAVGKRVAVKVVEGHEKQPRQINIDPSQTPSGKLARVPFSLHIDDARKAVDGVAIPLTESELRSAKAVEEASEKTPRDVVAEIKKLAAKIPG